MPDVEIPEEQYEAFENRAGEKGFDSADEYVRDVLRQVYEKLEGGGDSGDATYTEEEEEKVKDRLRGLGYMD